MNNKGIVSDVQNHLYKKMNLLETENKQLRDYVHMLRKVKKNFIEIIIKRNIKVF